MTGGPADGTSPRDVVRAGYDAIGERYHTWSAATPTRLGQLDRLMERLPGGCTVLDLGCGPGDPVARRLTERHRVVAVDVSAGQLAVARRNAPHAMLVQADVTSFAVRPGSMDAVVCCYVTGHLPPDAHAPLFAAVARWLRPQGLFLTTAPLEPGDGVEPDWLGLPMYFGAIGQGATLAALADAGLAVLSSEVITEDEAGVERFLWVLAQRPM